MEEEKIWKKIRRNGTEKKEKNSKKRKFGRKLNKKVKENQIKCEIRLFRKKITQVDGVAFFMGKTALKWINMH